MILMSLQRVAFGFLVLAHGVAAKAHEDEGCLSHPESSLGLALLQRSSSGLEHKPAAATKLAKQQTPAAALKAAKKRQKPSPVAKLAKQPTPVAVSGVAKHQKPSASAVPSVGHQQQKPSPLPSVGHQQQKPSPVPSEGHQQQKPSPVPSEGHQQLTSAVAKVGEGQPEKAVVVASKTSAQKQAVASASKTSKTSQTDGVSVHTFNSLVDVPVFVHLARPVVDQFVKWIFKPIMDTLEDAFTAKGAKVYFRYTGDTCEVGRQVKDLAWKGVRPIVISVCSHLISERPSEAPCSYDDTWKELRKNGAYLISYNSESHPPFMKTTLNRAKDWQVHEMWHYSKYIIGEMQPWTDISLHRFLPPGCAKRLDFAVDTDTPLREDTTVGFMGNWNGRTEQTRQHYAAMGSMIDVGGRYFTETTVRRYLQKFPVQLNIHGTFNAGSAAALESFRYAMLLANSACVVSEPGHQLDMDIWKGIVIFKKQWQMHEALRSLVSNRTAIDDCRKKSRAAFCEKFHPEKLLNESGFMDTWQGLPSLAPLSDSIANTVAGK